MQPNGNNPDAAATITAAVLQMNSGANKPENIATALELIDRAAGGGAQLVSLPEVWPYLGPSDANRDIAEPVPGPITDLLADCARRHGIYVHGGSLYETRDGEPGLFNTAVLIDPDGQIVARYSKIHMFDVVLDADTTYQESATITPGDEIVVVNVAGITVGLAICYDLRFPELFRILALRGAEVVILPAAFTMTTGKDHWETLIRARAIENALYMIAPAQWGKHPPGNWCYGRSMIVDPWGTVVATAADGVGVALATVDRSRVHSVRRQIPSLANRRPEAYQWPENSVALVAARSTF
jgi:predicted amidohydrolase